MRVGVFVCLEHGLRQNFEKMKDIGIDNCQLGCWHPELFTDENAKEINALKDEFGITVTAFWCGWSGPVHWNFTEGPVTLGLIPEKYRVTRVDELKRGGDFAKKLGITDVITHCGFLPESPSYPEYRPILSAIVEVAEHLKANGQNFLFETGQETPITLRRVIEDCDTGNLGINLDPANLILYGKANPVDALDIIGEFVHGVHAKDGLYPTNGVYLGREVKVGEGKGNFPALVKKLHELGYDGYLTIEREISGEQQMRDIVETKEYLEKLIKSL